VAAVGPAHPADGVRDAESVLALVTERDKKAPMISLGEAAALR
jgi:hypothetical protein